MLYTVIMLEGFSQIDLASLSFFNKQFLNSFMFTEKNYTVSISPPSFSYFNILCWPKYSFGFSIRCYKDSQKLYLANPILISMVHLLKLTN